MAEVIAIHNTQSVGLGVETELMLPAVDTILLDTTAAIPAQSVAVEANLAMFGTGADVQPLACQLVLQDPSPLIHKGQYVTLVGKLHDAIALHKLTQDQAPRTSW